MSKELSCDCGNVVENVDNNASKVTCDTCVADSIPAPASPAKKEGPTLNQDGTPRAAKGTAKPREKAVDGKTQGWHFKIYFKDLQGNSYSRGKLITAPADIAAAIAKQAEKEAAKASV